MLKNNPLQREFLCCFAIAIVTLFGYSKFTAHSLYSNGISFFESYCSFASLNCSDELEELDITFVTDSDFQNLVLFGERLLFKENGVKAASAKSSLEGLVDTIRVHLSERNIVSSLFWMFVSKVFMVISIGYLVLLSPTIIRESTSGFTGRNFREANKFSRYRLLVILTTSLIFTVI